MRTSLVVLLAAILSILMQYFSDIASIMTTALLFHQGGNTYLFSLAIAVVNVAVSYILVRFCAFRWFHLDFSKIGLSLNKSCGIGVKCDTILFGILLIYALCLDAQFEVLPRDCWCHALFNAFVNKGISTAIAEELIFRGFLFALILKKTNLLKAIVISTVVFVIPHMVVYDWDILTGFIFINYLGTTIVLTVLYYITGSLIAPIAYHALYNFILYGVWNVVGIDETSDAIFTQIYDTNQIIGYIVLSAIIQFGVSYILLHKHKRTICSLK